MTSAPKGTCGIMWEVEEGCGTHAWPTRRVVLAYACLFQPHSVHATLMKGCTLGYQNMILHSVFLSSTSPSSPPHPWQQSASRGSHAPKEANAASLGVQHVHCIPVMSDQSLPRWLEVSNASPLTPFLLHCSPANGNPASEMDA